MKILFDFIPIIIFFGSFKWAEANALLAQSLVGQYLGGFMAGGGTSAAQAPILLATAIAIVATVTQIGWLLARRKKVDGMLWVSFAIIVLFGGATIYFNSEVFIKWKPTVIYWFFASVLLGARLLFKRNLIRSTMEAQVSLPDPVWQTLNLSWVGFFLIMGCLNLYVAFYFPTPTWVNFKLFGGMGFMFAFVVAQSFYLARHVKEPE